MLSKPSFDPTIKFWTVPYGFRIVINAEHSQFPAWISFITILLSTYSALSRLQWSEKNKENIETVVVLDIVAHFSKMPKWIHPSRIFFLVLNFRIQPCFPFSMILNWWNKSPEWLIISTKRLSLPSTGHKGSRDDSGGGLRVIWNVISFR